MLRYGSWIALGKGQNSSDMEVVVDDLGPYVGHRTEAFAPAAVRDVVAVGKRSVLDKVGEEVEKTTSHLDAYEGYIHLLALVRIHLVAGVWVVLVLLE